MEEVYFQTFHSYFRTLLHKIGTLFRIYQTHIGFKTKPGRRRTPYPDIYILCFGIIYQVFQHLPLGSSVCLFFRLLPQLPAVVYHNRLNTQFGTSVHIFFMIGNTQPIIAFHQPGKGRSARFDPVGLRPVREKRFIRLVGYLSDNPVIHQTIQIFCQHKNAPGSYDFLTLLFRRYNPRDITNFFMPEFCRWKASYYPRFHMPFILYITELYLVRSCSK